MSTLSRAQLYPPLSTICSYKGDSPKCGDVRRGDGSGGTLYTGRTSCLRSRVFITVADRDKWVFGHKGALYLVVWGIYADVQTEQGLIRLNDSWWPRCGVEVKTNDEGWVCAEVGVGMCVCVFGEIIVERIYKANIYSWRIELGNSIEMTPFMTRLEWTSFARSRGLYTVMGNGDAVIGQRAWFSNFNWNRNVVRRAVRLFFIPYPTSICWRMQFEINWCIKCVFEVVTIIVNALLNGTLCSFRMAHAIPINFRLE